MLLKSRAKDEFNIEPIGSAEMDAWVSECIDIYKGNPSWLNVDDHIDTIDFAKALCSETARLAMLGTKITVDGSGRGDWIQTQIDKIYAQLRHWIEYGCAYGLVILKPNSKSIELYTREQFEVTHITAGRIDGVLFYNTEKQGDDWYTRLEYHRFEDDAYIITNKCYIGSGPNDTKKRIDIALTPWADLLEEVRISNLEKPLFAVFRTPGANNIDLNSPVGLPIFSEAVQELRDLDIAYSRNSKEIHDSKRTVLLDSDALIQQGTAVNRQSANFAQRRKQLGLPDYVRNVRGDGKEMFYQEINPTLQTDTRLSGINALIGQIGFKVGYSAGYFVFNEKTGMVTATQVESDDRRTIQFIKDVRDQLEDCIGALIYTLNAFADLYGLAPAGTFEAAFDFGDITYNREEDRARWWGYVVAGRVPAWMYFVKFEGMTEDEAKAMAAEAQPKSPTLFGGDE